MQERRASPRAVDGTLLAQGLLLDLEGEDDDLVALGVALQAGVAVGLEAGEWRKRDLLLPRVLPPAHAHPAHGGQAGGKNGPSPILGEWEILGGRAPVGGSFCSLSPLT